MKLIGLVLVAALWTGVAAAEPAVVETSQGQVQGVEEGGLTVYRGIPFAAPPTGSRRWRAPQPAERWQGVRLADRFGPICRQPAETPGPPGWGGKSQDEDCLRLNIWAPPQRAAERLPVMVWIHGGAYIAGSGSTSAYHGDTLARRGVVVVTINYRVGALGFLAHPELSARIARPGFRQLRPARPDRRLALGPRQYCRVRRAIPAMSRSSASRPAADR